MKSSITSQLSHNIQACSELRQAVCVKVLELVGRCTNELIDQLKRIYRYVILLHHMTGSFSVPIIVRDPRRCNDSPVSRRIYTYQLIYKALICLPSTLLLIFIQFLIIYHSRKFKYAKNLIQRLFSLPSANFIQLIYNKNIFCTLRSSWSVLSDTPSRSMITGLPLRSAPT